MVRRDQDERVGDEQRRPVAELVRGGEQPELVGVARHLDPPRVHDDVLRGGGEGDHEREGAERGEPRGQADGRHPDERDGDEQLRDDHPAAPPPEPPGDRRVHAIDDRRPEELERVGEPDPREEPDRLEARPLVAEPVAERVAREQERQPRREAEHQHHRDLGLAERRDDLAFRARAFRFRHGGSGQGLQAAGDGPRLARQAGPDRPAAGGPPPGAAYGSTFTMILR